jgi:hypothetical protein
MYNLNMTANVMNTIITSASQSMKAERTALGTRTTQCGKDSIKVRTVQWIAFEHPRAFTDDSHGGRASSSTLSTRVDAMCEFAGKVCDANIGTSIDMKPPTAVLSWMRWFIRLYQARTLT